jgi:hypothetical protein
MLNSPDLASASYTAGGAVSCRQSGVPQAGQPRPQRSGATACLWEKGALREGWGDERIGGHDWGHGASRRTCQARWRPGRDEGNA